jgi:hypothetical protein
MKKAKKAKKAKEQEARGPQALAAKKRPDNFESLSGQEQWDIDKRFGILDWDGNPNN